MEIDNLWLNTCAIFRTDVSDGVVDTWLAQIRPLTLANGVLLVTGPDRVRSWVELRYGRALTECATRAAGIELRVELIDLEAAERFSTQTVVHDIDQRSRQRQPFNPSLGFDQFVIGSSNQIAHAASLAVAERPGLAFNPLFIYGNPGVGKTHLLHAIGNFLRRETPEMSVRFMTAEQFASTFRSTVRDGSISEFKTSLRNSEVLLIDDIQFLQNKTKTEEEFFHTFNALHESGRQLVITCDRTPNNLESLAARLRERFESGLVVEIEPPEPRLRLAILRRRVKLDLIPLADEAAIERIAARAPANIRSLEGALIRVGAYASMRRQPVTPQLVDELLDALHPRQIRPLTVADIQAAVCDQFGIAIVDLLSPARDRRLAAPRQLAMFLSCELTDHSLPTIAAEFSRDHSTIVYARDKVKNLILTDPTMAESADRLRVVLHTQTPDRSAA